MPHYIAWTVAFFSLASLVASLVGVVLGFGASSCAIRTALLFFGSIYAQACVLSSLYGINHGAQEDNDQRRWIVSPHTLNKFSLIIVISILPILFALSAQSICTDASTDIAAYISAGTGAIATLFLFIMMNGYYLKASTTLGSHMYPRYDLENAYAGAPLLLGLLIIFAAASIVMTIFLLVNNAPPDMAISRDAMLGLGASVWQLFVSFYAWMTAVRARASRTRSGWLLASRASAPALATVGIVSILGGVASAIAASCTFGIFFALFLVTAMLLLLSPILVFFLLYGITTRDKPA